jgi:uncharacterized protein (TIGR02217 family)
MASCFHEVRFPEDISWGAVGGPGYSTGIVKTISGGEQRIQNWAQARCTYQVAQGVKSQEQLDALIAFFRVRKGKVHGFRYKDWSDFTAVKQYTMTGDGIIKKCQLQKVYGDSTYYEIRAIRKPVKDTLTIYKDDVEVSDTDYTFNYLTGEVEFDTAPAVGKIITASFEFDVPVRFDTDDMPVSIDDWQTYSWSGITIVEIQDSTTRYDYIA